MARPRRQNLQQVLENIIGKGHVYFNPPSNVKMEYPAIVYKLDAIRTVHADDNKYLSNDLWLVTLIDRNPDSNYLEALLALPKSSLQRSPYVSENLVHWPINIYY